MPLSMRDISQPNPEEVPLKFSVPSYVKRELELDSDNLSKTTSRVFLFDVLIKVLRKPCCVSTWNLLQHANCGVPQRHRHLVLLIGLGFKTSTPELTHTRTGPDDPRRWTSFRDPILELELTFSFCDAKSCDVSGFFDRHVLRALFLTNQQRLHVATAPGFWLKLLHTLPNDNCQTRSNEPLAALFAKLTTLKHIHFCFPDEEDIVSIRETATLRTYVSAFVFYNPYLVRTCEHIKTVLQHSIFRTRHRTDEIRYCKWKVQLHTCFCGIADLSLVCILYSQRDSCSKKASQNRKSDASTQKAQPLHHKIHSIGDNK